ncbi:hypothetical protein AMQ84_04635 [Paenibacillus riograndensis]|uniref:Uncharacterized protein n=1 Tax=Paenibacillus riograndensis TaxID=483937 RepID=A0A132U955_9BACL|nr:hypothetical protein [Paenibacillus riograndensis]KWX80169.1 hypothetical protein AMQ84_04635 [Paenibacillus riograndensis]
MDSVNILDSKFEVTTDFEEALQYVNYFMESYEVKIDDNFINSKISITLNEGVVPETLNGTEVKVHTTKHDYWNFFGEYEIVDNIRRVLWPTKKIMVLLDECANNIEIRYKSKDSPNLIGEVLFHIMRSLALYKRENKGTNFLHASSVVLEGKGIAFTGAASAGKTTLFLESIFQLHAIPLSNDRIYIKNNSKEAIAYSWPSYASFCEGTLLNYSTLAAGALDYQKNERNKYRTLNWESPLVSSFDKGNKRIYPMLWLSECIEKKYLNSNKLDYIFLSKLDPQCTEDIVEVLSYEKDYPYILDQVQSQLFDNNEPSFEQWHGISFNNNANTPEQFISNLKSNDCKFIKLHINPTRLYVLTDYLNTIKRS